MFSAGEAINVTCPQGPINCPQNLDHNRVMQDFHEAICAVNQLGEAAPLNLSAVESGLRRLMLVFREVNCLNREIGRQYQEACNCYNMVTSENTLSGGNLDKINENLGRCLGLALSAYITITGRDFETCQATLENDIQLAYRMVIEGRTNS